MLSPVLSPDYPKHFYLLAQGQMGEGLDFTFQVAFPRIREPDFQQWPSPQIFLSEIRWILMNSQRQFREGKVEGFR